MYIPNIYNCQQKDQTDQTENLGWKMWGADAYRLASLVFITVHNQAFSAGFTFCG